MGKGMANFESYAASYKHVRLERNDGVLELTIHKNGGPALWGSAKGGIHDCPPSAPMAQI